MSEGALRGSGAAGERAFRARGPYVRAQLTAAGLRADRVLPVMRADPALRPLHICGGKGAGDPEYLTNGNGFLPDGTVLFANGLANSRGPGETGHTHCYSGFLLDPVFSVHSRPKLP